MPSPAHFALEKPRLTLWLSLAATVCFGLGLFRLELRTDGAALYPLGNPRIVASDHDRALFGDGTPLILLATSRRGGPPIASPAGLAALGALHRELEQQAELEPRSLRSLANLVVPPRDLATPTLRFALDDVPSDPAAFDGWLAELRTNPTVDGLLLARDGRAAALYAQLWPQADRTATISRLERWIGNHGASPFELRLTGPVVAEATLGRQVLSDLGWLVPLLVLLVAVFLALCLGSIGGVVIPMTEVGVVLVWTLGAMGWLGVPVTLVTTILPVLLTAMAVADEIHLLERIDAHLETRPGTDRSPRRAAADAFAEIERPVLYTSLTTAAGFLAFLATDVVPLRHFGLFAAFGILVALGLTFTLVPALVAILPPSWLARRRARPPTPAGVPGYERRLATAGRRGVWAGLGLLAVAASGLPRLAVQDSWVENFDPRSALVQGEAEYNRAFWGSYRLDVVLTAAQERFFLTTGGQLLLAQTAARLAGAPHVGGSLDARLPFDLLAHAQGAGSWPELPEPERRRTLELIRLGWEALGMGQLLDREARTARLRLFVADADQRGARALEAHLERELLPWVRERGLEARLGGELPVAVALVDAIVSGQLGSIAGSVAGVGLLLALAFRSPRLAAVVMVPVLAAGLFVFAAMAWAGQPLGIATSMFAALGVGVGVDAAIHFTHGYLRARSGGADHAAATLATLAGCGRSVRWTVWVLTAGFLALTLSALKPNHSLGWLLALAMLASWVTTLLWLPPLLGWCLDSRRDP